VPIALSIVADPTSLEHLMDAGDEATDVMVGDPQPIDSVGDGLNFPFDGELALKGLQVVAASAATVNALRQLLEAWSRRRKGTNEGKPEPNLPDVVVVIFELTSGVKVHSSEDVGDLDIAAVVDRASELSQQKVRRVTGSS
jgi:hypothetical protein